MMAVTAGHHGRGLGARLLDALLAEATRRGHSSVSLEVRSDNGPAQRLYERRGFVRTGVWRAATASPAVLTPGC